MAKQRSLQELIDATYDDPALREWVAGKVRESETEQQIVRGERVLPHPVDAQRNMDYEQGVRDLPTDPHAKDELIMEMSRRVAALEQAQQPKEGA